MSTSAPKTRIAWGSMAKVESTYLTDPTLAATADGVLLAEPPHCDHGNYLYDGARGASPTGVPLNRAPRAGLEAKHKMVVEALGAGVAYSASCYPHGATGAPGFHALLRACGMVATVTATTGAEKWNYQPMVGPTSLDSVTLQNYIEGQVYKLYGGYGDLTIEGGGPKIPRWTFDFDGTGDEPTDVAIPTITYPAYALVPAAAVATTVTIGAFASGVVKDFTFKLNRSIGAKRVNIATGGGHYGFAPLPPNPTMELTVEKLALKTATPWHDATNFNPYQLRNTGQLVILSLVVGTTAYNRWKIWAGGAASAAQAQLVSVSEVADGPIGQWKLVFEYKPSTYALADMCAIQFD